MISKDSKGCQAHHRSLKCISIPKNRSKEKSMAKIELSRHSRHMHTASDEPSPFPQLLQEDTLKHFLGNSTGFTSLNSLQATVKPISLFHLKESMFNTSEVLEKDKLEIGVIKQSANNSLQIVDDQHRWEDIIYSGRFNKSNSEVWSKPKLKNKDNQGKKEKLENIEMIDNKEKYGSKEIYGNKENQHQGRRLQSKLINSCQNPRPKYKQNRNGNLLPIKELMKKKKSPHCVAISLISYHKQKQSQIRSSSHSKPKSRGIRVFSNEKQQKVSSLSKSKSKSKTIQINCQVFKHKSASKTDKYLTSPFSMPTKIYLKANKLRN